MSNSNQPNVCKVCNGIGKLRCQSGRLISSPCKKCKGTGKPK